MLAAIPLFENAVYRDLPSHCRIQLSFTQNVRRSIVASEFSHAVAALSIGTFFYRAGIPKHIWLTGALCSVVPDLDVIGFRFGIRYEDFWGHRGFTHSLIFAAVLSTVVVGLAFRRGLPSVNRSCMLTYFFLATASHGLLDAMTDGGLGVAFFSPLDNRRYFLPWTPIHVSPIGVRRFFTGRGLAVLQSELLCIWLPAPLLALSAWLMCLRAAPST